MAGGSEAAEAAGAAAAEEGATVAEQTGGNLLVSLSEERRDGAAQIATQRSRCKFSFTHSFFRSLAHVTPTFNTFKVSYSILNPNRFSVSTNWYSSQISLFF